MNLALLFAELRRRRVFRAAAAYLVVAWLVVQVAGTVLPMLEAPLWVGKVVIAVVIFGFAIALVLSWAFELTWDGIQRTKEIAPPTPGSGLLPRVALLALLPVVTGGGWLTWRWVAPPAPNLDGRVVAVLPFRVAGAEPSLAYLREGMLDLLAAKLTGELGPRAVDPRTLTSAWRRASGEGDGDLSREEAFALARGLGAGRLVLGEVVSMPGRVVLTASLSDVARGRSDAPVSVEGPVDSLPALVDRLVGGLLSVGAGEGERLASLTTTSLAALRLWLEGQAAYRGGRYDDAFNRFSHAVELDSTFALAAFGTYLATGWLADERRRAMAPAMELAWRHRERLGLRDRVLLTAAAGPNYPQYSSTVEWMAALEALVRTRPDDPEAWFWLGDKILHAGTAAGMADTTALRRSADAFSRSLQLDSMYLPSLQHLFDLALVRGDTTAARRYASQYLARDSVGLAADVIRNLWAAQSRGIAALPEILARSDSVGTSLRVYTLASLRARPELLPLARRMVDHVARLLDDREVARQTAMTLYLHAMDDGRHADAARYLDLVRSSGQRDQAWQLVAIIRDGLYWDGDPRAAEQAAAALPEHFELHPITISCTLGQWHLARSEIPRATHYLERLRELGGEGLTNDQAAALRCTELLETWRATLTAAPDAGERITRLDSVMLTGRTTGRSAVEGNLLLARLLEARGDHGGAFRALGRFALHPSDAELYSSTFLRERGRLAILLGDTAAAFRAYRHYIALRDEADPPLQPDVERVRAELVRLAGGGRQ